MRRAVTFPNLLGTLAADPGRADAFTGADLAAWRRACGLSQYRLAQVLGISRSTIARHELSHEPVSRLHVMALAGCERLVRREHALELDRLRHRVAQRRRRKREKEAQEAAKAAAGGYW